MNEKTMLVITPIKSVGLIAENGTELAKAFSNTYFNHAANAVADQSEIEALHFMGSVAGHALCQMFSQNISIKQLDSVLAQIRSYVIQEQGS